MELNFKKSETLKLNQYNLACWLRAWEKRVGNLEVWEYSRTKLKDILPELKSMTTKDVVDIKSIQTLLWEAWVYFSFIEWFVNVPVFWITRRYKWKAFIQISDRWKKADGFWFALFHELAHVQLHLNKKYDMLININNNEENKEQEANDWASNYFIDNKDFMELTEITPIKMKTLIDVSNKQWVWINILAWRLANYYNTQWYKHAYKEVSQLRTPLRFNA